MSKMKNGFTFSEMVITMGIMSVILMILIPAVKNLQPNQSLVMFKKAYYVAERAVSELVNDDDFYPDPDDVNMNYNLGNVEKVPINADEWYEGETKFCGLFGRKLNVMSESSPKCDSALKFEDKQLPKGHYITSDGVVWLLPITEFPDKDTKYDIFMDVNGDRAPNCFYNASGCVSPDRFNIKIYQNGRLTIEGKREQQYLKETNVSKTAGEFDKEEKDKNGN